MSTTADELFVLTEQTFERDVVVDPASPLWEKVCVCGHLQSAHSSLIGGTFRTGSNEYGWQDIPRSVTNARATKTWTMRRCSGQTRTRGQDREIISVKEDPADSERKLIDVEIRTTCECPKFVAVLEVYAPRAKFRQKHPVRGADGRRDPDPGKHAFARGMKAMRTGVNALAVVAKAKVPEDRKTELANRAFESRIRWIDRQCAVKGCRATANVWPAYVSTETDESELRCPEHRP